MIRSLIPIPFVLLISFGWSVAEQPDRSLAKQVHILAGQGKGTAPGRAAWDKVVAAGPAALPLLLRALDTRETVRANWLRTAFDRVVEHEIQTNRGRDIDAKALLAFAKDARHQGRARRLALEVVDRLKPGTSARLYPGWLE